MKKVILTIDQPDGPKAYKVAKDADVTVIFYNERKVEANHAFKKGELDEKAIDAVRQWKFKPGRKGGRDVPTHMQVPIVFTLNEE